MGLTSDQVWFTLRLGGAPTSGHAGRRRAPSHDGGGCPRTAARGDHHGRADPRHAPPAGGSRPLARDEHLPDPGGRPPARGPRARRARPAPRREGDGPRRRGAAGAVLDPARPRDDGGEAGGRALRPGRRRGGARAPGGLRRRPPPRRHPRRRPRAHGVPLHAVRGLRLGLARAADPAGVGQLRAVPARPPRLDRRAAGPARGARRRAARGVRRSRSRASRRRAARPPRVRDRHLHGRAQGPQSIFAF